jgi:hypothetical protein
MLYAQIGERTKALDALEKTYEQRQLAMTETAIEPAFDSIPAEPRFQDLLRRVGLDTLISKPVTSPAPRGNT